jgi:DNA invertase Pin-like site-specific DNA recombinase
MGVELKTLTEAIDTTTPTGAFFFTVIAAFAQLERDMISSRTKAALAEIKRTGLGKAGKPVTVGRPSALSMAQIATIKARLMRGERVTHLAREYRVSRTTIYARTGLRLHYVANDDVCLAA